MGVAFRCLIHLMREALPANKSHLRPFADGIALACGTPHPTAATPLSALDSQWTRVSYTKPSLAGAAAAWEGPRWTPAARTNHFDNLFGEPQRGEQGDGGWSEWGFALPNAGAGPRGPSIDEYSRAESTDISSVITALSVHGPDSLGQHPAHQPHCTPLLKH